MLYYFIAILYFVTPILTYSGGAPKTVCDDLTPKHGALTTQTTKIPYKLIMEEKAVVGQPLNVVLKGNANEDVIKGFIIQARLNNKPVGKFVPAAFSQTLECSTKDDTLTHQKILKEINQIDAKWIPSADLKGKSVQFTVTVVKRGDIFWVKKLTKNIKIE